MTQAGTRLEHDLLGELAVPADAYYGVQTARALTNFHISGVQLRLYPDLIKAFAMVKMAAARANFACGQFSREILTGIEKACQELIVVTKNIAANSVVMAPAPRVFDNARTSDP